MNEMASFTYELPLLEKRTYLHGTTLFDNLMKHVPQGASVSFNISRRIDSDCVQFVVAASNVEPVRNACARLVWRHNESSGLIAVVPLPASGVPRRESYDEALVIRALVRDRQTVVLEGTSPFSFVATIIPMFKALLADNVQPDGVGQWMFTRLDAVVPDNGFLPIRLQFGGIIGRSLTRSMIECDKCQVGTLYFSWVPVAAVNSTARIKSA